MLGLHEVLGRMDDHHAILLREIRELSDSIAAELQNIKDRVAAQGTVIKSAEELINSIPTLISTAVQQATAAGATAEQLQAFHDLSDQIQSQTDELRQSVVANTSAASEAPATDTPAAGTDTAGTDTAGTDTAGTDTTSTDPATAA